MQLISRAPIWARVAAVPLAVGVTLAGIWVAGGVLTDDFRVSMALTTVWFAAVLAGGFLLWRRLPALRAAAVAAVGTFVVVGAVLTLGTFRDSVVDEAVASGPALLTGSFEARAHPTEGLAKVLAVDGTPVLTLSGFRTDPGPDLFVYVLPGPGAGDSVDGGVRLARLKGNVGDQQYELPAALELDAGATVVIWCRAFSVSFGAAVLAAA